MPASLFPAAVLYEDNHLLVVVKPPNLPTMGVTQGRPSLINQAKQYIKRKYTKPGNVFLGVVSRLDAPVTGLVVFARTSKAASRLSRQFREGSVEKVYWAIVESEPHPREGRCQDWLRKDERHRKVLVTGKNAPGAKAARLAYRTLQRLRCGSLFLIEVQLMTGRKHQIRAQLAHRGWPILGDRKYGARQPFPHGIALHARRLAFQHPVRKCPLNLVAETPDDWKKYGAWAGPELES